MQNVAKLAGLALLAMAGPVFGQGKPAAVVNGESIPMAEFEAAMAMRPHELFPVSAAQQRLQRQEILELLISEKLMKQFLAKNAPPIGNADIDRQMLVLAESLKAQGKTIADFCRDTHQTEGQIRGGVANMLQYAAYARKQTTDDELKKYFEANRDFFQKTTVRISHIVIRIPANTAAAERDEARKRLGELRLQIAGGKIGFADAAKQYSQCPSAPKGGDIGLVSRKWMVDESVARTAFSMKAGEMSDVVASDYGLHLVHVTERNEGAKVEYAAVAEDVRDTYTEEMRQKLLQDLRRTAKITVSLP